MENYQRVLDRELDRLEREGRVPRLLLHACCSPCSSYVLEYLSRRFDITVFYYNPNISPESEYRRRVEELLRLVREQPHARPVAVLRGDYDPERFYELAKGHEDDPEGGERCFACYRLRLEETARRAKEDGFDCFTTTLSISPHKNAEALNRIGGELGEEYGVDYLFSDFKKRGGYARSIELSREYGLYRQDWCGCVFSKKASESRRQQHESDVV